MEEVTKDINDVRNQFINSCDTFLLKYRVLTGLEAKITTIFNYKEGTNNVECTDR